MMSHRYFLMSCFFCVVFFACRQPMNKDSNPDATVSALHSSPSDYARQRSLEYILRAEIRKHPGNDQQALAILEQYKQLADSITEKNRLHDITIVKAAAKKQQELIDIFIIAVALVIVVIVLAISYARRMTLNRKLQDEIVIRNKLFSVIGHDLRGPAGNLVQGLELIDTHTLPKPTENKLLHGLLRQARSLTDTLSTLLTWGRTQLKGIIVKPQFFNARAAAEKSIALLEEYAHQKKISISVQVPEDLAILTDQDRFDFIIRNLLSNAIKFSNAGGQVKIIASSAGNETVFSVEDQGIGLSAKQQKLFLDHRLESGVGTAGEKGTGLGLLLIKDFIKSSGGRIWVKSEPGKGTVFSFVIGNRN